MELSKKVSAVIVIVDTHKYKAFATVLDKCNYVRTKLASLSHEHENWVQARVTSRTILAVLHNLADTAVFNKARGQFQLCR